jgi:hypothetical protein
VIKLVEVLSVFFISFILYTRYVLLGRLAKRQSWERFHASLLQVLFQQGTSVFIRSECVICVMYEENHKKVDLMISVSLFSFLPMLFLVFYFLVLPAVVFSPVFYRKRLNLPVPKLGPFYVSFY